jgi:hypothetical protein
MHDVLFILGVGAVLRALEILKALPARLRATKRFPVKFDVEPFGGEETFLHRDEIVETHALGRDFDPPEAHCHLELLQSCSLLRFNLPRAGRRRERQSEMDVAHLRPAHLAPRANPIIRSNFRESQNNSLLKTAYDGTP